MAQKANGAESYDECFQPLKESLSDTYRELLPVTWGGRTTRNLLEVRRRFRRYMRAVEEGRGASPSNYREVLDRVESATEALARKSGAEALRPEWSYAERSLYDRAEVALSEQGGTPVLLRRHYRSHPAIIEFSSRRFYRGRLRAMRETEYFPVPEKWKGVRWFDVEGEVPSGTPSAYNEREIRGVLQLLGAWKEEGLLRREDLSVGVVTPFRAQEERIREKARQQSWWRELRGDLGTAPATIGTIHQYQGDARDLMIFSPVVAPAMKRYTERWVATTEQLLNVAITRARASLQVVSHLSQCKRAGGDLEAFVRATSPATRTFKGKGASRKH